MLYVSSLPKVKQSKCNYNKIFGTVKSSSMELVKEVHSMKNDNNQKLTQVKERLISLVNTQIVSYIRFSFLQMHLDERCSVSEQIPQIQLLHCA